MHNVSSFHLYNPTTIRIFVLYKQRDINNKKIKVMEVVIDFINRNVEIGMVGKSIYFQYEDTLVRIANHLPKVANIEVYNEDATKVILVFFESDLNESGLTECNIQDFIDTEMENYEVEYIFISEENKLDDYSEMLINKF